MKIFFEYIRIKIRKFLRITDPDVFMGVDYNFHEFTSLVLIKRQAGTKMAVIEILNFPRGIPYPDVKKKIDELSRYYGCSKKNIFIDAPREINFL